jgi:hypothetical protein
MFETYGKTILVIDIETAPTSDPAVIEHLRETLTPPGNYKKPESIAEWHRTNGAEALNERVAQTALRGTTGEVIAVGWNRLVIESNGNNDVEVLSEDPIITIRAPGTSVRDYLRAVFYDIENTGPIPRVIAGHNIVQFDLPFLWQQSLMHRLPFPPIFPVLPGPFDERVLDTMTSIVGHRNTISLKEAARALGIDYASDAGGSAEVPQAWRDGDTDFVKNHLSNDVRVTSELVKRIKAARWL